MQLAHRLDRIEEPQTIKMAKLSRELKAKGLDIIDLSIGEPDFSTPDYIDEAAVLAMEQGYTKYPPVAGFLELRQAICDKLLRDNNLHFTTDQIIVSTGAKQALANIVLSIINPGDEVIVPTPFWVTYSGLVRLAEGQPVFVKASIDADFKITAQQLEAAITERTRMFIFSSPCNPTGSVYSKDELAALAEVFAKYPQVAVVSDEIYEYINFDGRHESIAQFDAIKEQVIVVNGFSKGYAMTGWRLGYMAAPVALAKACEKFQGQFTSGANSIAQRAAITALNGDQEPTRSMTQAFKDRRGFMMKALTDMPGVRVSEPKGAFYMFPNISSFFGKRDGETLIETDEDMSMYLLHTAQISTVNGGAFGNDQCIRISFATSMEALEEAMKRMKLALAKLQ